MLFCNSAIQSWQQKKTAESELVFDNVRKEGSADEPGEVGCENMSPDSVVLPGQS